MSVGLVLETNMRYGSAVTSHTDPLSLSTTEFINWMILCKKVSLRQRRDFELSLYIFLTTS
jgi:hypothetical protein